MGRLLQVVEGENAFYSLLHQWYDILQVFGLEFDVHHLSAQSNRLEEGLYPPCLSALPLAALIHSPVGGDPGSLQFLDQPLPAFAYDIDTHLEEVGQRLDFLHGFQVGIYYDGANSRLIHCGLAIRLPLWSV